MTPDLDHFRLLMALGFIAAGAHAYRQVTPFFCATWFGSALIFGYAFAEGRSAPELVLLPGLVVYTAAAVTKGLVETRPSLAGAHGLHVLMTAALSGAFALPWLALARTLGFSVPRPAGRELLGMPPSWLGGQTLDAVLLWSAVGLVTYGVYKLLDHVGLPKPVQVILLFAVQPFLADGAAGLHGMF